MIRSSSGAVRTARPVGERLGVESAAGTVIRAIPPQWLLVVELEAHTDRGRGDLLASRDFEDIVLLAGGRPELVDEVDGLPGDARAYVTEQLTALLWHRMLDYGVEGALAAADARARADTVTLPRLRRLAGVERRQVTREEGASMAHALLGAGADRVVLHGSAPGGGRVAGAAFTAAT